MVEEKEVDDGGRLRTSAAIEVIKARLLSVVGVGLIIVFTASTVVTDAPRWLQLSGIIMIVLAPYGYIFSNFLHSVFFSEQQFVHVVELDASDSNGALYQFTPEEYRDLETVEGTPHEMAPGFYQAKELQYDSETGEGEIRANWLGTLSDREILSNQDNIATYRTQLLEDARKGYRLDNNSFILIRTAVQKSVEQIVDAYKKGLLPKKGEEIDEIVDAALQEFEESVADHDEGLSLKDLEEHPFDLETETNREVKQNGHEEQIEQ